MTTSTPMVIVSGQMRQLPSGNKLGGIAGGAATGEAMTQDQFGTNSTQMVPTGSPVFVSVDTPLITHSGGALELRPGAAGYDLDITLGTGTARAHITSSTGTAALTPTLLALTKTYTGGGPDTGGGQDIQWEATSSTTNNVTQAVRKTSWVDVTHATRKSRVTESVYDTSVRECLRMEASGSAAMIGFLGASASARLASPDIGTALTTFGLTSGTPTFAAANLTGLGTGVGTALAINVGTSGCFVVNGGALGTPSSGTVTNLTGTASININGTVGATTPSTGVFTDLTVNGNTIIGDASTDTVTVNAAAWTLPAVGAATKTKPAESGVAENLEIWKVSDSGSSLTIKNGTSNVSEFAASIEGLIEAGFNSTAITISGTKGSTDTTNPVHLFIGRYNSGSGNTDIPDGTPLTEFRNRVTTNWQYQIMGSGAIRRPRGTTRETQELQATVTTTDGTQTTLATITLTASYTYLIEARVTARRTGGTSGTADDGATYVKRASYTTKSGTVTLLGSVQTIGTDAEDQAGFDVTFTISGSTVLLRVTGATNNNVTWFAEYSWQRVNS